MPFYDYRCPDHGVFEVERSLTVGTPPFTVDCPMEIPAEEFGKVPKHLSGTTVLCGWQATRVFSPPEIIFKWSR